MSLQCSHGVAAPAPRSRQNSMLQVPSATLQDAGSSFEGFLVLQFTELQDRVASRAREFDTEMQLLRTMLTRALEAAGPEVTATIRGSYRIDSGKAPTPSTSFKGHRQAARDMPDYNVQLPIDPRMPSTDSPLGFRPSASLPRQQQQGISSKRNSSLQLTSSSLPVQNDMFKRFRPDAFSGEPKPQAAVVAPPPRPPEAPKPPSLPPSRLEPIDWTQDAALVLPGKTEDISDNHSMGSNPEHWSTRRDLQTLGGALNNGHANPSTSGGEGDSNVQCATADSPSQPTNGHMERHSEKILSGKRPTPKLGGLQVPNDGTESDDSETWNDQTGQAQGLFKTAMQVSLSPKVSVIPDRKSLNSMNSQETLQTSVEQISQQTSQLSEEMFGVLPLWVSRKTLHGGLQDRRTMHGAGVVHAHMDDEALFAGDHDQSTGRSIGLRRSKKNGETKEFEDDKKPLSSKLIIEPHSPVRFSWDILGLVLITGDAAIIPLQFFDPPRVMLLIVLEWVSRIFWSIDMPLSCFTGFISEDGAIEKQLGSIAYRYFTSWFPLDVVVVTFDWLDIILGSSSGGGMGAARAVKAVKFIRMLRLMRLMRLMKMPAMLNFVMGEVAQRFRSEKLFFVGKIGKVLFLIIGFVHVVGCFWYAIGESRASGWVEFYDMGTQTLAYRYMTSFHWSLANFAGAMDVEPTWVGERTFAVCVLLAAWMISATALSFITTAMTRDSFSKIQQSMQTVRLRRYLQEHSVNRKLQERLMKNAKYAISQKSKNMNEEDVELLQLVSVPLLIELHFEVNSPVLRKHPFFDNYADLFPAAIRRICHTAISQHSFSKGDVLFTEGEKPSNPMMYFVLQGELKYMQGPIRPKWLHVGQWACEPVIWSEWVHAGYLCSRSECTLLGLSTDSFYGIARNFDMEKVEEYATLFVKELNASGRSGLSDLPNAALNPVEMSDHVFHGIEMHEEHWAKPNRESTRNSRLSKMSGKSKSSNGVTLLVNGGNWGTAAGELANRLSRLSSSSRTSSRALSETLTRLTGSLRSSRQRKSNNSVSHLDTP